MDNVIIRTVPRFPIGKLTATPTAVDTLGIAQIGDMLTRHARGDWGDLDAEDKRANELALREDTRLLSCYRIDGVKFYIITEADRSLTTVLLAEEY